MYAFSLLETFRWDRNKNCVLQTCLCRFQTRVSFNQNSPYFMGIWTVLRLNRTDVHNTISRVTSLRTDALLAAPSARKTVIQGQKCVRRRCHDSLRQRHCTDNAHGGVGWGKFSSVRRWPMRNLRFSRMRRRHSYQLCGIFSCIGESRLLRTNVPEALFEGNANYIFIKMVGFIGGGRMAQAMARGFIYSGKQSNVCLYFISLQSPFCC